MSTGGEDRGLGVARGGSQVREHWGGLGEEPRDTYTSGGKQERRPAKRSGGDRVWRQTSAAADGYTVEQDAATRVSHLETRGSVQ